MENSVPYVTSTYIDFNFLEFFQLFCSTKNTKESHCFFKSTIQEIQSTYEDNPNLAPRGLLDWCTSIETNDYEVLKSDLLNSLWALKDTSSVTKSYVEQYNNAILNEITNTVAAVTTTATTTGRKRKANNPPPLTPAALVPRIEYDAILFGSQSVATIIKKDALEHFLGYTNATTTDQYRIALALNSTIDLTNVGVQAALFKDEEWSLIKKQYTYNRQCRSKLPREFKSKLKKINPEVNDHSLDSAYKAARKCEIDTNKDFTGRLFSIYAHLLRVYNERSYILGTSSSDVCSENDVIVKLWGEVFEILFAGKRDVYLRWGETTSKETTEQKKINRPGDKHVVGLKVDCRAVAYFAKDAKVIDLMNMEAAKDYEFDKISQDRIKLIAEAKCTLDIFLNSSALTEEEKSVIVIPVIQIAGSKCEVCCYRLVANGLYALNSLGSLTVSPVPTEFADKCHTWFKLLIRLKTMVLALYNTSLKIQQKNTKDFIVDTRTNVPSPTLSTRGTFFPPTEASPIPRMPPNLYSSSCPLLNDHIPEDKSNKRIKEN